MNSPYTQAVALLLPEAQSAAALSKLLAPLCPEASSAGSPGGGWINGYPWWRVPINGHPVGKAEILAASAVYPSNLGDQSCDEMTESCFEAGCLGPHALPCHALSTASLPAHQSVVVVRTSYAFGVGTEAAQASPNPLLDLAFVTSIAARFLSTFPGSSYFCPASGVLLKGTEFASIATRFKGVDTPPLPLWIKCRTLAPQPHSALQTVDTIGMAQLGQPDLEATFVRGSPGIDAPKVAALLMSAAAEGVRVRCPVEAARNGPGGLWTPDTGQASSGPPARSVIRWGRVLPM